jgi:DNA-3-methyladenine glycosylase I
MCWSSLTAQAGLSWSTILNKREAYRTAFKGFDPVLVAAMGQEDVEALLAEGSGIVRHRGKIQSTIGNAKWVVAPSDPSGSVHRL